MRSAGRAGTSLPKVFLIFLALPQFTGQTASWRARVQMILLGGFTWGNCASVYFAGGYGRQHHPDHSPACREDRRPPFFGIATIGHGIDLVIEKSLTAIH
ncbi:hypothetical protein [Parafrigoribacterium mesophilum]|uniref:hypothetical protein n=1 Tax=Parafrigoribacterium mesophilum TaxID=433646 RepID=UPI0031FDB598